MNKNEARFAVLLLFYTLVVIIASNFFVFAQNEEMPGEMTEEQTLQPDIIPSLSEWIGMFAIGIAAGLLVSVKNYSSNFANHMGSIIIVIAILSMCAGIIHLLLVQEHLEESFAWGTFFLITGVAQVIFGLIIIVFTNLTATKRLLLYYIGIAGNTLLVATFVFVRAFVPPFSPEETPVNELEPNGILTVIIEIIIVILLVYVVKSKEAKKVLCCITN